MEVEFPSMEAGGSYSATIRNSEKEIELNDILIGDIWICSGQSNMEFRLSQAATASDDIKQANLPEIRLLICSRLLILIMSLGTWRHWIR